ncbi:RimK family alpha-L-glutamate ligase, partial [Myxococcota bacterium]|nr:RimK family alpha-L-glutamate ligase [Myxococcota bacterium]
AVIRHLERLGVHTVNSSVAIDTVKDKLFSQQILAENNLPVPRTILVKFPINVDLVEKHLGFPVIVKTIYGAQGKGVFMADDRNQFIDMMSLVEVTNEKANIILQEYIEESRGRDLRVFTIGGRAVACMQRISNQGFKANYSQGGRVEPYEMTPEIEYLATSASRIMGLDIAGVDLLFDKNGTFKVCEINSAPGFHGLEEACGINIPQEVFHYLRIRLGQVKRRGE